MASAAQLSIELSQKGFGPVEGAFRSLAGVMGGIGKAAGGVGSAIGAVTTGLGKLGLAGLGVQVVADAARGLGDALGVNLASNLAESTSKVQTILGDSSKLVIDFARTSAMSLGVSQAAAVEAAGGFANLLKTTGLTQRAAGEMSVDLVKLSADLASFHNISSDDAMEKLRAGLVGEAEPLRQLGVLLSEDAVKAEAMAMGLVRAGQELTEAQKVQARYSLILKQTGDAQGDFARTSTGLANSQRIISAAFDDMRTAIGQRLLPVIAPLVSAFAQALPAVMDALGPILDAVTAAIGRMAADGWALIGPAVQRAMEFLPGFVEAIGQVLNFMRTGSGDIERFRGVLNAAFGPEITQGIIEVFANLVGFFRGEVLPLFSGLAAAVNQALGGDLQGALDTAGAALADYGQGLAASLTEWGTRFTEWVGPMIPPMLAEASRLGGEMLAWVAAQGPPLLAQLQAWGQQFIAWVGPQIPPLLAALAQLGQQFLAWVGEQAPPLLAKLAEWGLQFLAWVGPLIPPFLREVARVATELLIWLATTALEIDAKLLTEWIPAFLAWVGPLVQQLPGRLLEIAQAVVSWLISSGGPAVQAGGQSVGQAIIDGIMAGVRAAGPRLQAAMGQVAAAALDAAKSALGIRSPSAVMAAEVGRPMVEGIVAGLREAGAGLKDAVRATMGTAADAAHQQMLKLASALGGEARDAVMGLIEQLNVANIALAGLKDQMDQAERVADAMQRAMKPIEARAKAATAEVDRLKDVIADLNRELTGLGGGDVALPGEGEARQTIFGLRNALNILEFQRRDLLRAGAKATDPRVKEIDEQIKRNREELEYQEARLKATYDGQRNALDQAARAGTEQVASYEAQYARILEIKAQLTAINTEQLPAALASQKAATEELEAARRSLEAQRAVVDELKDAYEGLKLSAEQWKGILDNVLKVSKEITAELRRARKEKDAIDKEVKPPPAGGGQAAQTASFTIQNTIDARGMTPRQLTAAVGDDLAALLRARVVSGAT